MTPTTMHERSFELQLIQCVCDLALRHLWGKTIHLVCMNFNTCYICQLYILNSSDNEIAFASICLIIVTIAMVIMIMILISLLPISDIDNSL